VCWKWIPKEGNWTKIPFQPRDPTRYAKNNDPATWGTYQEALACVLAGQADGIGVNLLNSNLGALDLDHCRDSETGTIARWAQDIIARANGSYVEITVSGKGLRVIGTAAGENLHRKFSAGEGQGGIELYRHCERYITVSGLTLNGSGHFQVLPLPNIDALLDQLESELDARKRNANGSGNNNSEHATGDIPRQIAVMLHLDDPGQNQGVAEYEKRASLLFAFLTAAIRARVAESLIVSEVLDAKYAGKAIYEHVQKKGGREYLERQIASAKEKVSEGAADILEGLTEEQRAEIIRLASLSPLHYDAQRKEAAKRLNIRVGTLDSIVERLRSQTDSDDLQGGALAIPETIPWPEPVDGEQLVRDMRANIRKHVVLNDHQALAAALFCIHTHAREASENFPRLHVASPALRCGKSKVLDTIAPMVLKPLSTENISMAALFRTIEMAHPTLIIDEVDAFLKDKEEMRGLLNAGHARNGKVIRTVGDDFEPRTFTVAGPVVIAGIGHIPPTLEDRSITIPLRRKLRNEKIERLRSSRTAHLDELGRKAARWVADHIVALMAADPQLPEKLNDRQQDNWRPLIAIADEISADLGRGSREAAIAVSQDALTDDDSAAIMLLADVAAIMEEERAKPGRINGNMTARDLIDKLVQLDDRPWAEWRRGQPLTKNGLARLLRPFHLKPKVMREGGEPRRKYIHAAVMEAKARYVDQVEEEPVQEEDTETF
jgi:putative DNA primase/helicase